MFALCGRRAERCEEAWDMGRRIARCVVAWVLLVWGVPAPLLAEGSAGSNPFPLSRESLAGAMEGDAWDASAPVDIRSERMRVDFQKHEIVFLGSVTVTQLDFSLTADEVTAVFGDTAEDIRRIVARGDVRIRKGERVAGGREVVYDRPDAFIVLRGDPYLEQGRNFIRGEEIRACLRDDRVEILGDVSAEFRLKPPAPDAAAVPGPSDAP